MRPVTAPGLSALTKGGGHVFVNAEAATLVARFTAQPDNTRKALIDTTISALKASGIFQKADVLWFVGADSQASRRNWIADQYNLTAVGIPAFVADRGFAGDGAAAYLETGFNPTSAVSPRYNLNDAAFAMWSRSSGAFAGRDVGAASGGLAYISARILSDVAQFRVNRAVLSGGACLDASGLFLANRAANASGELYRNNVNLGAVSTATAVPNATFRFLMGDDTYSGRQLAMGYIGASLTTQQRANLLTIAQTYLQAIGAA
jgi:hypothetical protein